MYLWIWNKFWTICTPYTITLYMSIQIHLICFCDASKLIFSKSQHHYENLWNFIKSYEFLWCFDENLIFRSELEYNNRHFIIKFRLLPCILTKSKYSWHILRYNFSNELLVCLFSLESWLKYMRYALQANLWR